MHWFDVDKRNYMSFCCFKREYKLALMKIIVTGCNGFIGSHLSARLLKEGHIVVGVDIAEPSAEVAALFAPYKQTKQFVDLRDDIVTTSAVRDNPDADVLCNLAALAGVRTSVENPEAYVRTNVHGFVHLLQQCVENRLLRVVYASSSSVYGASVRLPYSESDPLADGVVSPYAQTKLINEQFAQLYARLHGMISIGLRFFTVYGPRGRKDMAPYKFLKAIDTGSPLTRFGDGEDTFRDYTYVDDIVNGIVASIERVCSGLLLSVNSPPPARGSSAVYNLGNGKPILLNDFIAACETATGKKAKIVTLPVPQSDVVGTHANIEKAQTDLGYNPIVRVESGLNNTVKWMRKFDT